MSGKLSRFELGLSLGVLGLAAFVGVLVVAAPKKSDAPVKLSATDSMYIAAQYHQQIALRGPTYHAPRWLMHVQIARLQEAAALEQANDDQPAVSQDSIEAVLAEAGGSYLKSMLAEDDGTVSRWRVSTQPIRVWIQPYSSEPGFTPDLIGPARRGFTAWNELYLGVQFEIVDDSTTAAVHVTWASVMSRERQIGAAFRITSRGGWIVLAHVVLSTAHDIYTVQNAVRHEAGHVLGLGHSPNVEDIMAAATEGRQYKITDADARTATLLYRLPSGPLNR